MPMTRRSMLTLFGLILTMTTAAASPSLAFGPGEAAGGRQAVRPIPNPADFLVVIWYRRDDPLGTFAHQVYDVRKGEYTTAVDEWVRNTRTNYPAYLVLTRPVRPESRARADGEAQGRCGHPSRVDDRRRLGRGLPRGTGQPRLGSFRRPGTGTAFQSDARTRPQLPEPQSDRLPDQRLPSDSYSLVHETAKDGP